MTNFEKYKTAQELAKAVKESKRMKKENDKLYKCLQEAVKNYCVGCPDRNCCVESCECIAWRWKEALADSVKESEEK